MNSLLTPDHLPRKDDVFKIKLESAENSSPVTDGGVVVFLNDSDEAIGDEEPLLGAQSDPLAQEYPGGLKGIISCIATRRCSRF